MKLTAAQTEALARIGRLGARPAGFLTGSARVGRGLEAKGLAECRPYPSAGRGYRGDPALNAWYLTERGAALAAVLAGNRA